MSADGERLDEFAPTKHAQFTTTHWSEVLAAAGNDSPQATEALENICRTYWYPIYAFVRRKGYTPEDAGDLTQGFFTRLISRRDFEVVRREKGWSNGRLARPRTVPLDVYTVTIEQRS